MRMRVPAGEEFFELDARPERFREGYDLAGDFMERRLERPAFTALVFFQFPEFPFPVEFGAVFDGVATDIVYVFPQFQDFPAVWFGGYCRVAGRVEVNTDPAGGYVCGWMNFYHLFLPKFACGTNCLLRSR